MTNREELIEEMRAVAERRAIVAWLRERAESIDFDKYETGNLWPNGAYNNLHTAADAIEQGQHITRRVGR